LITLSRTQKNGELGAAYVRGASQEFVRIKFGRCNINRIAYFNFLNTSGSAIIHNRQSEDLCRKTIEDFQILASTEFIDYGLFPIISFFSSKENHYYSTIDFYEKDIKKMISGALFFANE
jgi:hypothetical protein